MRHHIKSHKRRKRKSKLAITVFLIFSIFIVLFVMLDIYIRPLVDTVAISKAKVISTTAINDAVIDELSSDNVTYSDLITINKNQDSSISSIETNSINVNILKSNITNSAQNSLVSLSQKQLYIPIGTLLGSSLLAGKGPTIPINIALSNSITSDFKSDFVSAGVNQTKNELYVVITANISILLPFYDISTEVQTSVPIAETVIVGDVPQFYAGISTKN